MNILPPDTQKNKYQTYLKSDYWQLKRLEVLKLNNNQCYICSSSSQLNIHHLTYQRLGQELNSDLQVLCSKCHRAVHYNFYGIKIMDRSKLKHRAKKMKKNWELGKGYGLVSREGTAHPLVIKNFYKRVADRLRAPH